MLHSSRLQPALRLCTAVHHGRCHCLVSLNALGLRSLRETQDRCSPANSLNAQCFLTQHCTIDVQLSCRSAESVIDVLPFCLLTVTQPRAANTWINDVLPADISNICLIAAMLQARLCSSKKQGSARDSRLCLYSRACAVTLAVAVQHSMHDKYAGLLVISPSAAELASAACCHNAELGQLRLWLQTMFVR